jgi:hypothetical protein
VLRQTNPPLREIFPAPRPASGSRTKWSDDEIIECSINSRDASVIALGLYGAILGARLDLLVIDDA